MRQSFTNRVRQALIALSETSEQVSNAELAQALDLVGDRDKRPMYASLCDLRKSGEIERVRPGVHVYKGLDKRQPEIRARMWTVVRMRKVVSIEDLQELCGASEAYALEFMRMLARRAVVEKIDRGPGSSVYRLVKDGLNAPEDDEKSARLRRIRLAKKRALEELDAAGKTLIDAAQAIARARIAVNDMPEEDDHADQ